MIVIDKNKCPQNHKCPAIKVCPVDAIAQKDFELPIIDNNLCVECKKCIKFCPMGAIKKV